MSKDEKDVQYVRESDMNKTFFESREDGPAVSPILPGRELGAYEALWLEDKASFKSIADRFKADPTALPSDFVSPAAAAEAAQEAFELLKRKGIRRFGVRVNHAGDSKAS